MPRPLSMLFVSSLLWSCGSEEPEGSVSATAGTGGSTSSSGGMGGALCGDPGSTVQGTPSTGEAPAMPQLLASSVFSVIDGSFSEGTAPPTCNTAAMPAIVSLEGPVAVTNGGSATVLIQLDTSISGPRFVVELVGSAGYHSALGADANLDGVHEVKLQISEEATEATLHLRIAPTDGTGVVGKYEDLLLELVESGTGDVKITLSFDRTHDLDLHVLEPGGEEISFENPASANGGRLDLDSGSDCNAGTGTSENIFWPSGEAPTGEYRVTVHNYQQCTAGDTAYTVRIAHDDSVNTYRGTFADDSTGSTVEITTFTR